MQKMGTVGFGPRWREGSRPHSKKILGRPGDFPFGRAPQHSILRSQRRGKRGEWSVRVLGRWTGGEWNSGTPSTRAVGMARGWHRLIGVLASVRNRTGGVAPLWSRVCSACVRDVSGSSTSVSRRLRSRFSRIPKSRAGYPPFRPQRSRPLPPAWDQPVAKSFRAVGNREPGTPQLTPALPAHPFTHPPTASTAAQVAT